jgi:hypothetical protein
MDAEIDSLVVIGGGGREMVIDDDCSLVVRKGITNRVSAEYPLTVREIGNLFVGGDVGANVSVDRMRDRIPVDLILQRAIERQAMLATAEAETRAGREGRMVAALEAEDDAAWLGTIDGAESSSAHRKLREGVKFIGGVPEGGDGVADVFYIDRPGGKRVKATVIARTGDPAPGMPGTFFGILGTPAMRSDGQQALVYALLVGAVNGDSLWRWTKGEGLELVAHVGQQAAGMPSGVTYSWVSRQLIDDNGAIAFAGYMSGPGIVGGFNDDGVWYGQPGESQLVVQGGMPVPGAEPGVIIDSGFPFVPWSLSRDGNLVIKQDVVHPSYDPAWGLFMTRQGGPLETVAVTGQPVPAIPGAVVRLPTDARAALGDNGVLFRMVVMGEGIDFDNDRGTWMRRSGEFLMFQHEGYPAPGMGDPRITVRVGNSIPVINGFGQSAHEFRIQGPEIDFTNEFVLGGSDVADFSVFVQQGDSMIDGPASTQLGLFGVNQIDSNGVISFGANLSGGDVKGDNDEAFYVGPREALSLLIRSGDPSPDGSPGEVFSLKPDVGFANVTRNESHQLAISAHFLTIHAKDYSEAVWFHDIDSREWSRLFSEGETWDGATVPSTKNGFYFYDQSGTSGQRFGLADDGTLGVQMNFTPANDGMYAVQVIQIGDADEDGDVDLVDFAGFQICFTGPEIEASESCSVAFDSDGDSDVDLADFGLFQLYFSGPGGGPLDGD